MTTYPYPATLEVVVGSRGVPWRVAVQVLAERVSFGRRDLQVAHEANAPVWVEASRVRSA